MASTGPCSAAGLDDFNRRPGGRRAQADIDVLHGVVNTLANGKAERLEHHERLAVGLDGQRHVMKLQMIERSRHFFSSMYATLMGRLWARLSASVLPS